MSKKWDDHAAAYKKLGGDVAKHSLKIIKPVIADFINSYRKIEQLEDKLPALLIKARENGVSSDGLAAFKKDKGFGDAYKALDKEVDVLWAAQLKIKNLENEALATAQDLKNLADHIEKDIKDHEKDLKDAALKAKKSPPPLKEQLALEIQRRDMVKTSKELQDVVAKIDKDRRDLIEAGNLFDKQTDKKMVTYAAKFEKTIEKILDLAPDGKGDKDEDGDEAMPPMLRLKPFGVAVKKAVAAGKVIEKHCDQAVEKAQKDKRQADPELKAARTGIEALKKVQIALGKERKKHLDLIRKSKHAKDYERQFKEVEDVFASAVKAQRTAIVAIAKLP